MKYDLVEFRKSHNGDCRKYRWREMFRTVAEISSKNLLEHEKVSGLRIYSIIFHRWENSVYLQKFLPANWFQGRRMLRESTSSVFFVNVFWLWDSLILPDATILTCLVLFCSFSACWREFRRAGFGLRTSITKCECHPSCVGVHQVCSFDVPSSFRWRYELSKGHPTLSPHRWLNSWMWTETEKWYWMRFWQLHLRSVVCLRAKSESDTFFDVQLRGGTQIRPRVGRGDWGGMTFEK